MIGIGPVIWGERPPLGSPQIDIGPSGKKKQFHALNLSQKYFFIESTPATGSSAEEAHSQAPEGATEH